MTALHTAAPATDRERVLMRIIQAPREKMGSHEGRGQCTDQLAALVQRI